MLINHLFIHSHGAGFLRKIKIPARAVLCIFAHRKEESILGATGKFYGMSNDYMFRAVLQESEDTLKHLVGTLMYMKVSDIKECRIINPIILGKKIGAKDTVMDVRLELNDDSILN